MKVVITGGTGMLGRRLALRILEKPELTALDGTPREVDKLVLFDAFEPVEPPPDDPRVELVTGDICDAATVDALIDGETDSVFHFAAVVSGGAEADFDLGYAVNLDGGRNVLEAARRTGRCPRIVFTSSLAVYGGERSIDDSTALTPRTSYGTQKAIGELLVNDYTRKGFVDGRTLRLPTIVVRPGKPNAAASGFASSILREPLQGDVVENPVDPETRMLILSPKRAVQAFIDVHNADGESLGPNRSVMMNGISPTIGEMLEALRAYAGDEVADRVTAKPDELIQTIVDGWPWFADGARARALEMEPDASVEEIIETFVDEELGGTIAK
ncbi:MAG: SDR family oxidoreductase [Alphaproteobacteria bacterium]|nr:SDR family oxidoreductase [Alphaproteobacteria bacterium]